MAIFEDPTAEDRRIWATWVKERPAHVRVVAEKFEPWRLYKIKSTGHKVTLESFQEHDNLSVTMTVRVLKEFNPGLVIERRVFNIDPKDLEETDVQ